MRNYMTITQGVSEPGFALGAIGNVLLGVTTVVLSAVFYSRFRRHGVTEKWKYQLCVLTMMGGTMVAVWEVFFPT